MSRFFYFTTLKSTFNSFLYKKKQNFEHNKVQNLEDFTMPATRGVKKTNETF